MHINIGRIHGWQFNINIIEPGRTDYLDMDFTQRLLIEYGYTIYKTRIFVNSQRASMLHKMYCVYHFYTLFMYIINQCECRRGKRIFFSWWRERERVVPERVQSWWDREWGVDGWTRRGHHQAEPRARPSPPHLSPESLAPSSLWSPVAWSPPTVWSASPRCIISR